jgi:hypothetical protein
MYPQENLGSPEPTLLVEKIVSIAFRDHLIKSIFLLFSRARRRESLKIIHKTDKRSKRVEIREGEQMRPPSSRAKREN